MISLLDELKNVLPPKDIEIVREYVEYNEFGVGFEHICDQLFEDEIQISAEIYQRIENIGKDMEMDGTTWTSLKNLVKND